MKLFVENQDLNREVERVLGLVRLRMNGTTTGQMEERGIKYRVNYGVGFPHLKELASGLTCRYDLAERLWFKEIRETMLLAALIVPHDEMTLNRCLEWSALVNNADLVERTSMVLWGHLPLAGQLAEIWKQSRNEWMVALANYTLGWSFQYRGVPDIDTIDKLLDEEVFDNHLYLKSFSFVIRKVLRVQGSSTPKLAQWVRGALNSENDYLKLIAQEILSEIQFVEGMS